MTDDEKDITSTAQEPPEEGRSLEEAEETPDRPTNDPEDTASAVQEEEAREQSGI